MLTAIIAAKVQADMENEMYKSLITGLMEDLHDIREFGEPQGWKTVIAEDKKTTLLTQKDFYGMDREIYIIGYAKTCLRYLSFDDTLEIIKSEFDLDDYMARILAQQAQKKLEDK